MTVKIKKILHELEIKNSGIEFAVSGKDGHVGDLVVKKAGLVWCPGKTGIAKGKPITWAKFIRLAQEA